ncbi:MAG: SDR family oxidoreductase [Christensenellaceae bacterium]|nr:SDR family oxidoreductase [Christensenellaceae bacterium]
MKQKLEGKVAVITGAGSGIGRAAALKLAEEKMNIVLLGGRNADKVNETAKLVSEYTECLALAGDLKDEDFLKASVKKIIEVFGGIDALINNAGIATACPFEETTREQFDEIMDINVKVPYFLTKEALPYLKKSNSATVINISSVVGHLGYPLQSAYTASKHAVLGFSKSFANEYYKDNIRTHVICPGGVYTDLVKLVRPDLTGEGMIAPEEIAEIIHFFLENRGNAVIDEIFVHRVNKEPFQVT